MDLPMRSHVVDLGFVRFFITDNDIVVSDYMKGVVLDLEKSKLVHSYIGELCDYKPKNQLFLACDGLEANREVRAWGLTEDASKYTIKSAIVCESLAHRIIGNVLINLRGFPRQTKILAETDRAISWLLE